MVKDLVLILFLLTCAYTDFRRRLIYNRVLLPVVVFALIYAALSGGVREAWLSIAGMILGLALLIIPFYFGGIGAGDVKMLATIGALQGPVFTLHAFFVSAVVGGIWAFVYLFRRGKVHFLHGRVFLPKLFSLDSEDTIPYGTVLALGTLLTYWGR